MTRRPRKGPSVRHRQPGRFADVFMAVEGQAFRAPGAGSGLSARCRPEFCPSSSPVIARLPHGVGVFCADFRPLALHFSVSNERLRPWWRLWCGAASRVAFLAEVPGQVKPDGDAVKTLRPVLEFCNLAVHGRKVKSGPKPPVLMLSLSICRVRAGDTTALSGGCSARSG